MKKIIFVLTLIILLVSCGSNSRTNSKYDALKINALKETDIFTYAKVKSFLENKKELNNGQNELFLKGLNSFKNDKNSDSALIYFTESILKYPTNIAYYEFGNVLLETKQYDEAILAYEIAEKLGYEPFSKVLYNISCAHSLANETALAGQYLEFALQAGYSNIENINKDDDLKNLRRDNYNFESHLQQGLKGMSNAENLFWLQFKRKFNRTPFPITLDENLDIIVLNDETMISYDFEKYIAEMRDEKFSREISKGFYYLTEIKETDEFVALIYVIKEEFYGDESPLTFKLATFNSKGKLIDKKEIAGRTDFSKPLKSALIKNDLSILITSYETIFEHEVEKVGYHLNKIIEKKKLSEETFTIAENGKIIKKDVFVLSSK